MSFKVFSIVMLAACLSFCSEVFWLVIPATRPKIPGTNNCYKQKILLEGLTRCESSLEWNFRTAPARYQRKTTTDRDAHMSMSSSSLARKPCNPCL